MDTFDSVLDKPITLREVLPGQKYPRYPMKFEAYMALPRGYHKSNEGKNRDDAPSAYSFPWSSAPTGHALAFIAAWSHDIPPRMGEELEGGQRCFAHFVIEIEGEPLLLKPIPGKGYPTRFAVAAGPHEGVEVEYAI